MRRKIAPNSPGIVALRRCYRRISPIAVRLGEGPMSDHAADVQPARREPVFVPLLRPLYRHRAMAGMGKAADLPGVARIRDLPLSMFNRLPLRRGSMRGNISPNRPEIRGMSAKATSSCRRYRRRDNRHTYASHLVFGPLSLPPFLRDTQNPDK